jgi:hypothetical protein
VSVRACVCVCVCVCERVLVCVSGWDKSESCLGCVAPVLYHLKRVDSYFMTNIKEVKTGKR